MTNEGTTWVYVYSRLHDLYTTGFYDPTGEWQPDADYTSRDEAAERVHWLNGGDR